MVYRPFPFLSPEIVYRVDSFKFIGDVLSSMYEFIFYLD